MNMYRWPIINKHGGSAFLANDFLTRNYQRYVLWSPMYNQDFIAFRL